MDLWFLVIVTLSVAALLRATVNLLSSAAKKKSLPPGPLTFPVIGNLEWLDKSLLEIESVLCPLHAHHGPMVTIHVGLWPAVFVSSQSLTHQALIHRGAVFADCPLPLATTRILTSNQHIISSSSYDPTWCLLCRNLMVEILRPSRIHSYSGARAWVLDILVAELKSQPGGIVRVVDHFQYAMFCLLLFMCFGDKIEEKQIKKIEEVHRRLLLDIRRYDVLNIWQPLSRLVLQKRWKEFYELFENRKRVLVLLIQAPSY